MPFCASLATQSSAITNARPRFEDYLVSNPVACVRVEDPRPYCNIIELQETSIKGGDMFLAMSAMAMNVYCSVVHVINAKGVIFNEAHRRALSKMLSAFSNETISSFAVDYNKNFNAIILYLLLNGTWHFRLRYEVDESDDDILTFAITIKDCNVFEGSDQLATFGEHVATFFAKLKQPENIDNGYSFVEENRS